MSRTASLATSRRHLLIMLVLALCICSLAAHFLAESLTGSTALFAENTGHPGDQFVLSIPPLPILVAILLAGSASSTLTRLVPRLMPLRLPPN